MVLSDRNRFRAWQILIFLFIAAASLASYWGTSSLFFYADDFFWLERGKFFSVGGLSAIFSVEKFGGLYFDPLVHLSFYLNHLAFGLDPAWYHRVDILIHIINAILVSYLTLLLTKNTVAVFFSGLLFAVSHANSDSVLWPSSRVDTLAALFYLLSIISYRLHMIKRSAGYYLLSAAFFITSLASKSTPVVLPIVLYSIEIFYSERRNFYKVFLKLLPFFLISAAFLILLFLNSPGIPAKIDLANWNFKAFLNGIMVLFFPESLIAKNEFLYMLLSALLLLFLLGLSLFIGSFRPAVIGLIMVLAIIFPLLLLKTSVIHAIATKEHFYYTLGSIYHRLYLAVIGFAILGGAFIGALLTKNERFKTVPGMLILGLLAAGIFWSGYMHIQERERVWSLGGRQYLGIMESIKEVRKKQSTNEYSRAYVINPPFTAFLEPMFRVYLDNERLKMLSFPHYSAIPDISSNENVLVGVFISTSKMVDITQHVRMYQSGPAACKSLKNIEASRECWDRLSALTQELNKLLYNN